MNKLFIEKEIKYIGSQLSPHWIYKNFHLNGNSIVAFIGECDVKLSEMVDIEDVINNEPIYSKKMLSFIEESFDSTLSEMVFKQRLLVTITKEILENEYNISVLRKGDDLFYNDKKLSVSIATKSITSTLIHFGLNINSENAPVNAAGLTTDLEINDIKFFANRIMQKYEDELNDIQMAVCKVRGVF